MADIMTDTPTQHILNTSMKLSTAANTTSTEMGTTISASLLLTQDAMQPEIKNEPPEDINDIVEYNVTDDSPTSNEVICNTTKIRLTPTNKLLASPIANDPKRKFICPYENCTKSYGKSSHLRSHLTWHTGIKPFVCKESNCGKGFTRSDELNRHMRTHTGEKPFECVQCTKKFSRSDHLTKHLGTHAKQLQNIKTKLGKASSTILASAVVSSTSMPTVIVSEKKKAATVGASVSSNVNAHTPDLKQFSNDDPAQYSMTSKTESQSEELSTNTNTEKSLLVKLEKTEAVCENDNLIIPDFLNTNNVPFKNELTNGYEDENNDDNVVMPEANVMLPTFPAVHNNVNGLLQLKNVKAEVTYNSERPHQCKDCLKSFKRTDDLNRHIRTHTGFKPYACTECEKRFLRGDHLKKHLNRHLKKR